MLWLLKMKCQTQELKRKVIEKWDTGKHAHGIGLHLANAIHPDQNVVRIVNIMSNTNHGG